MKDTEFIVLLCEALEIEEGNEEVTLETELDSLDNWNSLSVLSLLALLDEKAGINLPPAAIAEASTVGDIYLLTEGPQDAKSTDKEQERG